MTTDKINPSHYKSRSVECIDIAERLSFCAGNALKYIWRAGEKQGVPASEDWAKAAWYLRRCATRGEQVDAFVVEMAIEALCDSAVKSEAIVALRDGFEVAAAHCSILAWATHSNEWTPSAPPSVPEDDCDEPTKGDECVG